jgi:hypothetical protein
MDKEMLQELGRQFGMALDWSKNSAVPYLQDLAARVIQYERITSIAWLVSAVIVFIGVCFLLYRSIKERVDDLIFIGLICILFVLICVVGNQINDLILCATLPEKIILYYLQNG